MRLAGYARVSITKDEAGLEGQEERLEAWSEANEHDLRLFSEMESAARGKERPVFRDMMEAVLDGDSYDGVVVEKLDRFGRSLEDIILNVRRLDQAGKVIIVKDLGGVELDTSTSMGRFIFHVFAAVAELERDMIYERLQRGRERAMARGVHMGRPRIPLPKDRILELYRLGVTQKRIAAMHGVTAETIRKRLREWGE